MTGPLTQGAHHIGLTVHSIDVTGAFFREVLGYEQLGEVPGYPAVFLSDGTTMITLWQVANPESAAPFDRQNVVGLHHLALRVGDHISLDELHTNLEGREEVAIEFAPELLGDGPTRHLMCLIPGGIRVEFISPAV